MRPPVLPLPPAPACSARISHFGSWHVATCVILSCPASSASPRLCSPLMLMTPWMTPCQVWHARGGRYREAAQQGHANAQCDLGQLRLRGTGIAQDDAAAVCVPPPYTPAQRRPWQRPEGDGRGGARGAGVGGRLSIRQWTRAAVPTHVGGALCAGRRAGLAHARRWLGAGFQAEWFQESASLGHSESYYWLGLCCLHGHGVAVDRAAAARHLRKAADDGHEEACGLWVQDCAGILGRAAACESCGRCVQTTSLVFVRIGYALVRWRDALLCDDRRSEHARMPK